MTEISRALVLPDFGGPQINDLLSLLLVWDAVEVDVRFVRSDEEDAAGSAERQKLVEEGLVRETRRPFYKDSPHSSASSDSDLIRLDPDEIARLATKGGRGTARAFMGNIREALSYAGERGLAPLAVSHFSSIASSLPSAASTGPRVEGAMIHVATPGISLDSEATVDDVLLFRERNAALIGRFRASLIDLAAAIDAESSAAAIEQARSVLVNRIEPAVADLSSELDRGRISFAIRMLMGATTCAVSPVAPAALSIGGGRIAAQSLKYAFDRDRLVREHPYGLLYRARDHFGEVRMSEPNHVVTDPEEHVAALLERMLKAALEKVAEMTMEEAVHTRRDQTDIPASGNPTSNNATRSSPPT